MLISGSGVDVERFRPSAEPAGPVTIAFAGRLIEVKGIRTLIEALRLLRGRGSNVELLIAGTPDPANPTSIPERKWRPGAASPACNWLGHVEDIAGLWQRAAIAVLPSQGGEGVPMSLLEAAAAGRPMIATDVPGCREIVGPARPGCWCRSATPPRSPARSRRWPVRLSCAHASAPPRETSPPNGSPQKRRAAGG